MLSYALFPQIARPFLERRAKGLGGKEEFAAAIAAVILQQREAKASKSKTAAARGAGDAPWKMAGRAGLGQGGWQW